MFLTVADYWAKSTAAKGDYFEGNTFSISCKYKEIFAVISIQLPL